MNTNGKGVGEAYSSSDDDGLACCTKFWMLWRDSGNGVLIFLSLVTFPSRMMESRLLSISFHQLTNLGPRKCGPALRRGVTIV